MKKTIKKLLLLAVIFVNILCTEGFCDMTVESMEESLQFYNQHKFIINLTTIIYKFWEYAIVAFIIIIPIIIIYIKIKQKIKKEEGKTKHISCLLKEEVALIINFGIMMVLSPLRYGSEWTLYDNIIIIMLSLIINLPIIAGFFKKEKKSEI
jgi:hypothetical protein